MRTLISPLAIAVLVVVAGALAWATPGVARNCDSLPTCSCGDTLQFGRTLTGADPVVDTVCTGEFALKIIGSGGITLDLGGRTIRCGGADTATKGIVIETIMSTVPPVLTVQNGAIEDCAVGVTTARPRDNLLITSIRAVRNGTGFDIQGSVNRLIHNIAEDSVGVGIRVEGFSVFVEQNDCDHNGSHGIHVPGDSRVSGNNFFTDNICSYNRGDGILVERSSATMADNQARSNRGRGIFVPF